MSCLFLNSSIRLSSLAGRRMSLCSPDTVPTHVAMMICFQRPTHLTHTHQFYTVATVSFPMQTTPIKGTLPSVSPPHANPFSRYHKSRKIHQGRSHSPEGKTTRAWRQPSTNTHPHSSHLCPIRPKHTARTRARTCPLLHPGHEPIRYQPGSHCEPT